MFRHSGPSGVGDSGTFIRRRNQTRTIDTSDVLEAQRQNEELSDRVSSAGSHESCDDLVGCDHPGDVLYLRSIKQSD